MHIHVVPHDPRWPAAFDFERRELLATLGDLVARAHHIGSTAVAGLAAKPVIDILLEVRSLAELDDATPSLEALGYEALGEFGIAGRRYFRKGGDQRTHQIHAFGAGDPHIHRHLAFRDYLQAHPGVREEYARLKSGLAERHPDDLEAYCEGKDAFVKLHEAKALAWTRTN